jgi:crotonobetainyl-CoA:carnitine CoA-transferase CaiB-like acyl-CoA transferase
MFETVIEFLTPEHYAGAVFEPPLSEFGYPRVLAENRKPFPTADGYCCIMPYSNANWRDFVDFIGKPELKDDPRLESVTTRGLNVDFLYGLIVEAAPKHTTAEWVAFCDRASIPSMPVLEFEDLRENEHVKAVGLFETVEHPSEGRHQMVRRPVNFAKAPFELRRHAPRLGEHTREVLAEAGLTQAEIDEATGES